METIAEELRVRRVLKKLSQAAVAKEAGIHRVQLNRYERGVHIPQPRTYQRVISAIERLAARQEGGGNY